MKKIILLVCLAAAVAATFAGYSWLRDHRMSNFGKNSSLYVTPEMDVEDVVAALDSSSKVLNVKRLRRVFKKMEVDRHLQAGHYVISASSSSVAVARMLNNGRQTPVKLTIAGSLRSTGEIARKLSNQLMLDSLSLASALQDSALLAGFGVTPENVFAAFHPATYEVYWTDSLPRILERNRRAADAFWTEERLSKAAGVGLDRRGVTVLASIVKGESNYRPELSKIAGVYLNRLKKGMKLQADPTVAYCYGYSLKRVLFKHLEIDSLYNTYKYAGLPPAPICVPDPEYLEAVLNPDYGGGNLYFCASPSHDGSHVFAKTAAQHGRNARAFQKSLK
ncbi:MAG: endolytic transglycosylase MltG [Bacteroidales bacterium]|nr:endolytic transglycosylase MltG [Bacteroidales bacterium]